MTTKRERKSSFVKLFDKTPSSVQCPHFYELVLSNGCPYDCSYCYLKLTFRGNTKPTLFTNDWSGVEKELDRIDHGVFSTGELADSLAVVPPLLDPAIDYFQRQNGKYLLLVTKSDNLKWLEKRQPDHHLIISFSVNSEEAWKEFEKGTPSPNKRMQAAVKLRELGWRVRIRLDPMVLQMGLESYEEICVQIRDLNPEVTTVGTLRQFPGVHRFSPQAPRKGLVRGDDGRMRYTEETRIESYLQVAEWLGSAPALCKETKSVWKALGWEFKGCNCTA